MILAASRLRLCDKKLTGFADGATHIVPAANVLYFESVNKRTFFYTASNAYETTMHLYEIEDKLAECGFLRTNKSTIVNLKEIASLRSDLCGRMIAMLSNNELTVISRSYTIAVKNANGM